MEPKDHTAELNVFEEVVFERDWPVSGPQAFDWNGVLPDEVGLAKHVHVVHDEPEVQFPDIFIDSFEEE